MNKWNSDTVLNACRQLDQQRLHDGITTPLNSRDIRALRAQGVDTIPSMPTIQEYVGNMDTLQALLGRVTSKNALAWDEETWQQNAEWAQSLITELGHVTLSGDRVEELSTAGLMPNEHVIAAVWGSIPAYRLRFGIEKKPTAKEAVNWDHDQFVINGKALAAKIGEELGVPVLPKQADVREAHKAGEGPSLGQIIRKFKTWDHYIAELGFVNSAIAREWSDQQWKDNFEWLKDVVTQRGEEVTSVKQLLATAARLGVSPSPDDAVERWGSMLAYAKHVGFEYDQLKRGITDEGFMRIVYDLAADLNRPITNDDLRTHPILSVDMSKRRLGGLRKLNESVGWLFDTKGWSKDKLLWWGVNTFVATTGRAPLEKELVTAAKRKTGPAPTKIRNNFDGSIPTYQKAVEGASRWMQNELFHLSRANRFTDRAMDKTVLRQAIRRNPELFHPNTHIGPHEISILYKLKDAGTDMRVLAKAMDVGISFSNPSPQLMELFDLLAASNTLFSSTLRKLTPYIPGLAPLDPSASWSDEIRDYRARQDAKAA